jgi:hypothetical protein
MKLPSFLTRNKGKETENEEENEEETGPPDMIWIGIGNAGMKLLDKVYSLNIKNGLHEIHPIGIKTSTFDCPSPVNIEENQVIKLGDEKNKRLIKGTGGDQKLAQEIFFEEKEKILERISKFSTEHIPFFLLGALGGGTGGGGIPVLNRLIRENFAENPVYIIGRLPDSHEGSTLQANASRSLHLLEKYDALILFENRTIRNVTIEEGYNILNDEFAKALSLLFSARPEEYALNQQEMKILLRKYGKEGICLAHYSLFEEVALEKVESDQEKEVLKSDMIRLLKLNLSFYPKTVFKSAKGGAYHIGSNMGFLLHDLVGLLNTTFENILGKDEVHLIGGFLKNEDYSIEMVTMLVGVDQLEYGPVKRISEKWKVLYEEDDIKKDKDIVNT